MAYNNSYRQKDDAINVSYDYAVGPGKAKWRSEEDRQRVGSYDILWSLYTGLHYEGDGGVWAHPYGQKGKDERIPYQQINMLSKASRVFADLVIGEGILVSSANEATQQWLEDANFRALWEAVLFSSIYGFVGLQPYQDENGEVTWYVIKPHFLYPEFHKAKPGEIVKIVKSIPYLKTPTTPGKTKDFLYQEIHSIGQIEYKFYEIAGENIIQELDIGLYKELIDPTVDPVSYMATDLDDFMVSLLYNDKLGEDIFSDYSPSAQKSQCALNSILTQIDRILHFHSDPKLIAPESAFVQDPESGKWVWACEGSEVLIRKNDDIQEYSYLTWDGQLSAAIERRDNLILSIHTELDISPQLTAFIHLTSGTTAETAAKLKKLLHATIKRAGKKREWAYIAIESLIINMLKMAKLEAEFSIEFPEIIPQGRDEILDEVITRKQIGLITTPDALMWLDNLSEEDARAKAVEIFNEQANSTQNPFAGLPDKYMPPVETEQFEEEETEEEMEE